jgi:hypothetical protein
MAAVARTLSGVAPPSRVKRDRGAFIAGSDARIIMGDDEPALHPASPLARKARRGGARGSVRQDDLDAPDLSALPQAGGGKAKGQQLIVPAPTAGLPLPRRCAAVPPA